MDLLKQQILVTPGDPFTSDALGRETTARSVLRLITTVDEPFSIGIAAPWGAGKSTFLQMCEAAIDTARDGRIVCHFDAWSNEEVADPIVALSLKVEAVLRGHEIGESDGSTGSRLVASGTRIAAKTGAYVLTAASAVLPLVMDAGATALMAAGAANILEKVADELPEAVAKKQENHARDLKEAREDFRVNLGAAVQAIRAHYPGDGCKLLIVVDELDRCRPDFALRFFERIKHYFDIPGVVFVLAYDPEYVMSAAQAVYGTSFHSERYFRKFVDIEINLPASSTKQLVLRYCEQLQFKTIPCLQGDYKFSEFISILISGASPKLTPRDVQQYLTLLRLSLQACNLRGSVIPWAIPPLILARFTMPAAFKEAVRNGGPYAPLLQNAVAPALDDAGIGNAIAFLRTIAKFVDHSRNQFFSELSTSPDDERKQWLNLLARAAENAPDWVPGMLTNYLRLVEEA